MDTKAAFAFTFLGAIEFKLGVNEDERHHILHLGVFAIHLEKTHTLGVVGNIDNSHANVFIYLRGSKTNPLGIHHGFNHVLCKLEQSIVHLFNGTAFFTEDWVSELSNFEDHL